MKRRRALITGITGQDGALLAKLLLDDGYAVYGMMRRTSSFNTWRIDRFRDNPALTILYGDMCDGVSLRRVVAQAKADEIYNFAAQSHVGISFDTPESTIDANGLGTLRLLEATRAAAPEARIYQASSSEMFGNAPAPQNEETPLWPVSPYGAAKVCAHNIAKMYGRAYGLHVVCGILFNHESPLRSENFVSRKIAVHVARWRAGQHKELTLGDMDARRDWGWAPEYVEGIRRMMARAEPADYVLATGRNASVREFLEHAAKYAGLGEIDWSEGKDCGLLASSMRRVFVRRGFEQKRPLDIGHLRGDASKAKRDLGWTPQVTVEQLIERMVDAETNRLRGGRGV